MTARPTVLRWPRASLSLVFRDTETDGVDKTPPPIGGKWPFSIPRVGTLEEVFAWRSTAIRTPRPLLLDLFCGGGGASMGYYRAGFDVIGVDIAPQRHYPFPFIRMDALDFIQEHWWQLRADSNGRTSHSFSAVHASPPCQRYSMMSNCRPDLAANYPDLVDPVRTLLDSYARVPWVIENVPGAPLIDPITLCGFSFGYDLYRHRLFESNVPLQPRLHLPHTKPGSRAGHWTPGHVISVSGHCAPMAEARKQMDISWTNREELAEAVPPYYTEYIGKQLMLQIDDGWARYGSIDRTSGHYEDEQAV